MTRRRPPFVLSLLVLALLGVLPACRAPARSDVLDLAARGVTADHRASFDLVELGTPAAEPAEESGFVPAVGVPAGRNFVWAEPRARILLSWRETKPRVALLRMAPHPDLPTQSARVSLNGTPLGEIRLVPGPRWYRVVLPVERQLEGRNHIELKFSEGTAPIKPRRDRLAASLHALAIGAPDDPALEDLLAEGAPPAVGLVPDAEPGHQAGLVQVGPSVLEFVLRLPEAAELRFLPQARGPSRAAGSAVPFRVTLQGLDDPGPREIWHASVRGGEDEEIRLALPGKPGSLVRLGLGVGAPGERFAWGLWRRARVLGIVPPDRPEPHAAQVAALRRSVAGDGVLFVILDAARADHFGLYGYGRNTTPNIDRIGREGVVFDQAYTTSVFTLIAMSSVWTSKYPDRHHNGIPYNARLPRELLTLSELLSAQGIRTAGFISNAVAGKGFGLDRGFEEFEEILKQYGGRASAYLKVLPPWLQAHRDDRFFLYAHVREPHFPYNPIAPFDTMFGPEGPITLGQRGSLDYFEAVNAGKEPFDADHVAHIRRLYDGGLAFADRQIGRLREVLEKMGLWDRMVVIITADHGEGLWEHRHVGHIIQLYEESVHIPLVVHFPERSGLRGRRIPGFVSLVDLAPTIADLYGVLGKGDSDHAFEGRTLLPMLYGAPGEREVYLRSSYERARYAIRDQRYKLIFDTRTGVTELYDLSKDTGETVNLADSEPLRASYYRQRLEAWILDQRRGPATSLEESSLKPDEVDNLKALGYVQ